jgi:cytoskeletal protein RodZ
VFARGHLKRYGELLGMNVAELERGMLQGLAAQPDLARIVTRSAGIEEPRRSIGIKPLLIVTCALILIALIWWLLRMQPRAAEVSTTTVIPLDPPVTVTGEPAVLAPAAPQITPMAGSAASTAGGPVAVPAMSPTRAKPARAPAVTPRRRPARAPPVTEPAPEPEPAPAPVSETRSDRTDVN